MSVYRGRLQYERPDSTLQPVFLRKTTRWPQLRNGTFILRFLPGWISFMSNFVQVEPLSVTAFARAMLDAVLNDHVLDIGANMGFYTTLAADVSPKSVRLTAVEMQPRCIDIVRCHLWINGVADDDPHRVQTLNRYVTHHEDENAPAVRVPKRACDTMASPTATAGRRPDGTLRSTQKLLDQRETVPVRPIAIGRHMLTRMAPSARIAATKIDTEGFEPRVLAALRPVWHRMADVILELQPLAWRYHNISLDEALSTLRAFAHAPFTYGPYHGYAIVTLPHASASESAVLTHPALPELIDPCRVRSLRGSGRKALIEHGMTNARVMRYEQLEAAITSIVQSGGKGSGRGFFEVLFARRKGCEQMDASQSGRRVQEEVDAAKEASARKGRHSTSSDGGRRMHSTSVRLGVKAASVATPNMPFAHNSMAEQRSNKFLHGTFLRYISVYHMVLERHGNCAVFHHTLKCAGSAVKDSLLRLALQSNVTVYEINGNVLLSPNAKRERWFVHPRTMTGEVRGGGVGDAPVKVRLGSRSSLSNLCPRTRLVFTFVREPLQRFVSGYSEWVYRMCRPDDARRQNLDVCPPESVRPKAFLQSLLNGSVGRLPQQGDLMHMYPIHRSVQTVNTAASHFAGGRG